MIPRSWLCLALAAACWLVGAQFAEPMPNPTLSVIATVGGAAWLFASFVHRFLEMKGADHS